MKKTLTGLACLLVCVALTVQAAPFTINEMPQDMSDTYYNYRLSGPDISLLLPVGTSAEVFEDSPERCILVITDAAHPDVVFSFFAFQVDNWADRDLALYSDAALNQALGTISDFPEALTPSRAGEVGSDVTAVWADEEREGIHNRHLVAFHQGWVFNCMVTMPDGSPVPEELKAWQMQVLSSAFDGQRIYTDTWALRESTFTVPQPFLLFFPAGEQGNFAYLIPDETGAALSLAALYVFYDVAPVEASLDRMEETELRRVLTASQDGMQAQPLPEDMELVRLLGYPGVIRYEVSGMTMHAALSGGTLLLAVDLPRDDSQRWEGALSLACVEAFLGRETTWPTRVPPEHATRLEGDALIIPATAGNLRLQVPNGYTHRVLMDDVDIKLLGLEREGAPLYILRMMPYWNGVQAQMEEDSPGRAAVFNLVAADVKNLVASDVPDSDLTATLIPDCLLHRTGGVLLSDDGLYAVRFVAHGSTLLMLSIWQEGGQVNAAQVEDMGEMIGLIQ